MKQEEQDAIDIANQHSKDKDSEIENHAAYFWERILTPEDRNQLAGHDIHSSVYPNPLIANSTSYTAVQDLERAYFEADVKMTTKPFPKLEQLPPKFQIAHELHKSIPHRVNTHRKAKAMGLKSFFGGIF
uniref:Uncharacterized protein n=1 Tax=Moniliophthora roreri TaxID=221103 RepID=A0A0W0FC53_MONRR